jgi:hypothetical protein
VRPVARSRRLDGSGVALAFRTMLSMFAEPSSPSRDIVNELMSSAEKPVPYVWNVRAGPAIEPLVENFWVAPRKPTIK